MNCCGNHHRYKKNNQINHFKKYYLFSKIKTEASYMINYIKNKKMQYLLYYGEEFYKIFLKVKHENSFCNHNARFKTISL